VFCVEGHRSSHFAIRIEQNSPSKSVLKGGRGTYIYAMRALNPKKSDFFSDLPTIFFEESANNVICLTFVNDSENRGFVPQSLSD
jgi:hypothetical protein